VLLFAEVSVGVLAGWRMAEFCADNRSAGALFSRGISSGITVFK